MSPQQKENLKLAVAALRANQHKNVGGMRHGFARCCLCVMSDLAEDIKQLPRGFYSKDGGLPDIGLAEVYGIPSTHSDFFNFLLNGFIASVHNDGALDCPTKSHAEIADMIEAEYLNN